MLTVIGKVDAYHPTTTIADNVPQAYQVLPDEPRHRTIEVKMFGTVALRFVTHKMKHFRTQRTSSRTTARLGRQYMPNLKQRINSTQSSYRKPFQDLLEL